MGSLLLLENCSLRRLKAPTVVALLNASCNDEKPAYLTSMWKKCHRKYSCKTLISRDKKSHYSVFFLWQIRACPVLDTGNKLTRGSLFTFVGEISVGEQINELYRDYPLFPER